PAHEDHRDRWRRPARDSPRVRAAPLPLQELVDAACGHERRGYDDPRDDDPWYDHARVDGAWTDDRCVALPHREHRASELRRASAAVEGAADRLLDLRQQGSVHPAGRG